MSILFTLFSILSLYVFHVTQKQ